MDELQERLSRLKQAGIELCGKTDKKLLITLKRRGFKRVFITVGDQQYLAPYFFNNKGHLCVMVYDCVYMKRPDGSISVKEKKGKWMPAENVILKASALGPKTS